MPLEVGSVVPFEFRVFNADNPPVLINPTTIAVTITLPDGTTKTSPTDFTIPNPPAVAGIFPIDFTSTIPGTYYGVATITGPIDVSPPQSFYVSPAGADVSVVALADFKTHLNIPSTSTTADEELRTTLVTATEVAERWTDRRWRRAVITAETHDGGACHLALWESYPLSVTTVVESGTTLSPADYVLDINAGILWRGTTTTGLRWRWGRQNIAVTYVAGPPDGLVPTPIRQGIMEMARHLWQAQRGPGRLPLGEGEDVFFEGFAIPRRAVELWQSYQRVGVA